MIAAVITHRRPGDTHAAVGLLLEIAHAGGA